MWLLLMPGNRLDQEYQAREVVTCSGGGTTAYKSVIVADVTFKACPSGHFQRFSPEWE